MPWDPPQSGLRCDGCRGAIKPGEQIYSCVPCDFDACAGCGGSERDGGGAAVCEVVVLPGDWGEVTLELTRRYGTLFASLNIECLRAATLCGGGCNPMCWGLQPYVAETATVRGRHAFCLA